MASPGQHPETLRKRHNLQGPIDDAFMDSFIFVRPTGTAANEAVGKWAEAELTRAIEHWRRHFRGDARVVNDVDLTDEMIQSSNIVLWGDPKSNSVLAKIADKLPIQWTADKDHRRRKILRRQESRSDSDSSEPAESEPLRRAQQQLHIPRLRVPQQRSPGSDAARLGRD
ncbi:MAG: hypothetical protein V9G29_00250 [Burkholderiaceae bacterium]